MAVEKSVRVTISAVDQYSNAMGAMAISWNKIAMAAGLAEAAIIAASVSAAKFAVNIGTTIFREAAVFHDGMLDVKAVTGEAGASMEQIEETLNKLVVDFPLTGQQASEAMELIAQRGNIAQDSMEKLAEAAVTLNIATGSDMNTNIELLSTVMNALGYDLSEVDRVMNSLAATQFNSAISVTELRQAWKFAAPIAAQLGWSVEETNAALAMLRSTGVEATQAGTILRQAMYTLMRQMPKTKDALAELGLTIEDVNPQQNSLNELIAAFDGKLITAEQSMKIFGTRQGPFTLLVQRGSEAFRDMQTTVSGTTAAIDAMEEKMKQWSTVVSMVEGDLSALQNVIGRDLVPEVVNLVGTSATEGIRGVITRMNELESMSGTWGNTLVTGFQNVRDTIIEAFDVQDIDTFYQLLAQVWDALVTNVEIVAIWGAELIKAMKGGAGSVETLRLALWVVHAAFASISAVVVGFHDLWVGFKYAVNLGVDAIQYAISYMMVKINEAIADTWRLIDGIPWVNVTGKVEDATRAADEWRGMMDKSFDTKAPNLWADNWVGAVTKSGEAVMNFGNRAKVDLEKVKAALDDGKIGFDNLTQSTDEGIKQIDVYGNKSEATFRNIKITTEDVKRNIDNATGSIDKMAEAVAEVEYEMEQVYEESGNVVTAVTKITTESSKTKDIVDLMEDGFRTTKDDVLVIGGGLEKVSDQVGITSDGTLVFAKNTGEASDKMTEIANMSGVTREELENMSKTEVKLYTERFKSDLELVKLSAQQTHDLVKTKMEWEAKLEIARLEADSKKAVAAFETIAESVSAAAAATADMFGGLAGATSSVHFYELKDLVEQQLAIEKALADAQIALVAEQTEYMKNQNEKLKRGEATQIIQVTVEGNTEAWLKGLMESLFSEIIVKASAEAFSCLGPTT